MLAGWLREKLGTLGAEAMVRKFGAREVLDALYDGVVCDEPVYEERDVQVGAWADGSARTVPRRFEVGRRQVPSPALRNPGGFLYSMLVDRASS